MSRSSVSFPVNRVYHCHPFHPFHPHPFTPFKHSLVLAKRSQLLTTNAGPAAGVEGLGGVGSRLLNITRTEKKGGVLRQRAAAGRGGGGGEWNW
jgi:hypothetical protein